MAIVRTLLENTIFITYQLFDNHINSYQSRALIRMCRFMAPHRSKKNKSIFTIFNNKMYTYNLFIEYFIEVYTIHIKNEEIRNPVCMEFNALKTDLQRI